MVIGKKLLRGVKTYFELQTPVILSRMNAMIEAKMKAKIKALRKRIEKKSIEKKKEAEYPGIEVPYYFFEFLEEEIKKEGIIEEYPIVVR
ncbi:MAG: hypothetical protein QXQ19_00585, partial [Candidatus Aenigmatarchaeota archaeon]